MRGVKMHCLNFAAFVMALMLSYLDSTTANSAPKITLAPSPHRVMEDGTVSFFCRASGKPTPTIRWKRDGKRIRPKATRHRIEIHDQTPHISALRIRVASAKKDNATFTCLATNDLGKARSDARLYVYPKLDDYPTGYPTIENHLKLRSVEKNRNVLLKCDTKGDPKPRVQWLKDALPVDVNNDPRIQVLESGYLQIRNSQESDQGTYECVAENKWGVAYSYRAMIYVRSRRIAPKFSKVPDDQRVAPGSDVNLTCIAYGSPRPFVRWSQGDDVPVGLNVLVLNDVRQSKNYTCEASSDLGKIYHTVQVIVQAPGSPPENVMASAASATTVLVSWDPPKIPNGVIKGYKVFYTTKPGEPIFFWDSQVVNSDNRVTAISGLKANVTYAISVLAFSSVGQGPMSRPIQVLTTQGVFLKVPYQPINLVAEAISANVILVKWNPPQEAEQIMSYQLYFNDSYTRQNGRVSIDPPIPSYRLEDLIPDTTYHIQVSARSQNGEGPKTPTVQVHTPQFVPGVPRHVRLQALNSTGFFVEWDAPNVNEQNGIIRGYQVHYIEVDAKDKPIPGIPEKRYDTFDPKKKEAVITGLKPDSFYLVQVSAYTKKGDGLRSRQRVILTKGAVPSAPRNLWLDLTQDDPPNVKVTWMRPVETHGDIHNYKIIWGPQGGLYEENVLHPDIYSYLTPVLDRGTTYEFQVFARNDVDYGQMSVKSVTTPDGLPSGAPQNFTATGLTETSVRLTWDLPARRLRNGDILMYQITYHKMSEGIYEEDLNSTDTFLDLVGLEINTDYFFKIKAYTSKGSGPWSNRLHFRTFGRIPPKVDAPEVLTIEQGNVLLKLNKASELNGVISHYHIVVVPKKASGVNKMPSDSTLDEVWYFLFPQTLKDGEDHEDRKYKTLKMKKNFLSPWFPKLFGKQ